MNLVVVYNAVEWPFHFGLTKNQNSNTFNGLYLEGIHLPVKFFE